jgi:flagellar motor switch protein FliN/FliY
MADQDDMDPGAEETPATDTTPESGEINSPDEIMASDSSDGASLDLGDLAPVTEGANLLETADEIEPMRTAKDLEAVYDIPVQLSAVLGKSTMQVSQLLKLGRGAVVELDRKVGEAIDIYVNNRLVARGEVVVVEERLGVTMTEIIKSDRNS